MALMALEALGAGLLLLGPIPLQIAVDVVVQALFSERDLGEELDDRRVGLLTVGRHGIAELVEELHLRVIGPGRAALRDGRDGPLEAAERSGEFREGGIAFDGEDFIELTL